MDEEDSTFGEDSSLKINGPRILNERHFKCKAQTKDPPRKVGYWSHGFAGYWLIQCYEEGTSSEITHLTMKYGAYLIMKTKRTLVHMRNSYFLCSFCMFVKFRPK